MTRPHPEPGPDAGPLRIDRIAAALGARVLGRGNAAVTGLAHPAEAGAADLALALDPSLLDTLRSSPARAAVLAAEADLPALGLEAAIVVDRGRLAMAGLTRAFDPGPGIAPGLHATVVADGATIAQGAAIGPFTVIGEGAVIGAGARIGPHVSVAPGVQIGAGALIHAGVRIGRGVRIGARVIVQPGAAIGADGFSFVTECPHTVETARRALAQVPPEPPQRWQRIHSLGGVAIGDDVEVGANSTIDGGTVRATRSATAPRSTTSCMSATIPASGATACCAGRSASPVPPRWAIAW